MSEDHEVSALPEKRNDKTQWRGRCRCGITSFMTYSTKDQARMALRRTHLISVSVNEGDE